MKVDRIQMTMHHTDGSQPFLAPITFANDEYSTGEWITDTMAWINSHGGCVSAIEITAA